MSKGIRYDAVLVRALAAELDARFSGRPVRGLRLSTTDRTVTLALRDETLIWDLHPDRGWLTIEQRRARTDGVGLPAGARIGRIAAPPDERLIEVVIDGEDGSGAVRRLIVELFGTHRNAIAVDADDIARAVLRPRPTAARVLAVAKPYRPLPPASRSGSLDVPSLTEWRGELEPVEVAERKAALLESFAWTSPVNARYLLAAGDLVAGYERYLRLREAIGEAWVLWPERTPQPYPVRLGDDSARRETDLVAAFATSAALLVGAAASQSFIAEQAAALERVRERLDRAALRVARLKEELTGAPEEAAALRHRADLLLAQQHRVMKGATTVELDDFADGTVVIELDPSLPPHANAAGLYDAARKRERAAIRIPKLLRAAESERATLAELEARLASGEATPEEVALHARGETRGTRERAVLPYRVYRTTGGLEVRVGRSSRANDALTTRHSSPDDIWLHAESVPGAHVVLRWGKRDANPSARDIHEAGVLAAVHSRARTSGVVPVTWTRRKYVRKPRRAGPGVVTTERAKTIFVEPSVELERRLRVEES